jgi:hypothetical protein
MLIKRRSWATGDGLVTLVQGPTGILQAHWRLLQLPQLVSIEAVDLGRASASGLEAT